MSTPKFSPEAKYEGIEELDDVIEVGESEEFDSDEALEVLTAPTDISSFQPTGVEQKRESIRGILASIFIIGFFLMLGAGFLLAAINDLELDQKAKHLQDILLTISGVLSGPLGFVVGYYFRKSDEAGF